MYIKNLAQLKKDLQPGTPVQVFNFLKGVKENRIIVKTQTNGLYTGAPISNQEYLKKKSRHFTSNHVSLFENNPYTNKWLPYQKAKDMRFLGNKIQFLAYETELSSGRPCISPSSEFQPGDVWLELIFS